MGRAIVSPDGQSATFVELFFDLVFVFGLTQIVGLLHHDLSWTGAGQAALVFWMVWWAWTQFTWALNAADTTHPFVELATLLATAIAFFMAVAVPGAFGESSLWFAGTYVLVRVVGLTLYAIVGLSRPGLHSAVRTFSLLSVGGLVCALLGGYLGGEARPLLWGMTIVLDVVAALGGTEADGWDLHAEHFAERHGLIVIIALGESLIVAAGALVGSDFGPESLGVAVLAVLVSCGLWWTYFPIAKPEMEEAVAEQTGLKRTRMARDAYTLGHFPMLCGVVAYAVALEEALAHPTTALPDSARLSVGLGLMLFLGGTAFSMWRTTCGSPLRRIVIAGVTATAAYVVADVQPIVTLGIAASGVVLVAFLDELKAQRSTQPSSPSPG